MVIVVINGIIHRVSLIWEVFFFFAWEDGFRGCSGKIWSIFYFTKTDVNVCYFLIIKNKFKKKNLVICTSWWIIFVWHRNRISSSEISYEAWISTETLCGLFYHFPSFVHNIHQDYSGLWIWFASILDFHPTF